MVYIYTSWQPSLPCTSGSVATLLLWKSTRFHYKKTLVSQKNSRFKRKLTHSENLPENVLQCQVAIHMLQVLLPLLLQKPSLKSKNREHVKYLNKRMEWWKHGQLEELISECEAIQKRFKRSVKTKKQSDQKAFYRLMLQGQVKKALKIVNHANDIDGKHDITADIKKKLTEKHPKAAELKQSAIIDKP